MFLKYGLFFSNIPPYSKSKNGNFVSFFYNLTVSGSLIRYIIILYDYVDCQILLGKCAIFQCFCLFVCLFRKIKNDKIVKIIEF